MFKSLVFAILLFAPAAFAGEAFVSCRQVTWRHLPDLSIHSLKTASCARVRVGFFETTENKTRSFCESWSKENGVTEMYSLHSFPDQIACTQDEKEFRRTELLPVRPLEFNTLSGNEYWWYQDSTTPFIDKDENRERARWVNLNGEWYCGLPGQSFYAHYNFADGENSVLISGLSLSTQKFEWKSAVSDTIFWKNADTHSPFAYMENSLKMGGHNFFVLKDKNGNTIGEFRMTYLVDVFRDPMMSCY